MRSDGRLTALLALVVIAVGLADAQTDPSRRDLADAGFHLVPLTPMPTTAMLHGPTVLAIGGTVALFLLRNRSLRRRAGPATCCDPRRMNP